MKDLMIKEKLDLLSKSNIFMKLRKSDIKLIAQYSEFCEFDKGQIIYEELSEAEEVFIIKEGDVVIAKNNDDNKEMILARFISGETFGELDLLDLNPRIASARAEIKTILLRFPKKNIQFKEILAEHSFVFAGILQKLLTMITTRIRNSNKLLSEKTPWIQELRNQLLLDKLTGLYNRTYIDEEFPNKLLNYGVTTGLLFVKPDNFKYLNDTFGHQVGDEMLKLIGNNLNSIIQETDIAARYKSNEFVVIFPDSNREKVMEFAGKLSKLFEGIDLSAFIGEDKFRITFSMGLAFYPEHSKNGADLVKLSYEKMYESWNSGGNKLLCV